MEATFSGDWTVEGAISGDVTYDRQFRFSIAGSLASDGVYKVSLTLPPVSASGPSWSISVEYYHIYGYVLGTTPGIPGEWLPFDVRRTSAAYTLKSGLVVLVGTNAGNQFLICRNVDPQLNPWHPFANPYDFRLPKRRKPKDPVRPPRKPGRSNELSRTPRRKS